MTHRANITAVAFFMVSWSGVLGQTTVQGQSEQSSTGPLLIQPLNQATQSPGSGSQPAYGALMSSVQPVDPRVAGSLFLRSSQTNQTTISSPQKTAIHTSSGRLAAPSLKSASSWSAGSAAIISGGAPSGGPNYTSGPGYSSALAFSLAHRVPIQPYTSPSLNGNSISSASARMAGARSNTGSYRESEATPESGNGNSHYSSPAHASSPATYGEHKSIGPAFALATSEGMTIRLTGTADGLQLILQTKNNLDGSILSDQSGLSKNRGDSVQGWWAWTAGAGSWTPINVLTSTPLSRFEDPGQALIKKMTPAPRVKSDE